MTSHHPRPPSGVVPKTDTVDYEYDWRGRRIKKVVTGTTTTTAKYLYDGWNLVAELDGNNALVRSYMWGLDLSGSAQGAGGVGGLLYTKPASGSAQFCAYDGNGNVMALVDGGNGTLTAEYEYGAFGETLRANGASASLNPFRFSTKFTDDESDFVYYGYRYLVPSAGRWLNRDVIAERGGLNVYAFSRNCATDKVDPLGLLLFGQLPDWQNASSYEIEVTGEVEIVSVRKSRVPPCWCLCCPIVPDGILKTIAQKMIAGPINSNLPRQSGKANPPIITVVTVSGSPQEYTLDIPVGPQIQNSPPYIQFFPARPTCIIHVTVRDTLKVVITIGS